MEESKLFQRALVIKNVKDSEELTDIHPRLQFDSSFSDAKGWNVKSQIVVPIKDEILWVSCSPSILMATANLPRLI